MKRKIVHIAACGVLSLTSVLGQIVANILSPEAFIADKFLSARQRRKFQVAVSVQSFPESN